MDKITLRSAALHFQLSLSVAWISISSSVPPSVYMRLAGPPICPQLMDEETGAPGMCTEKLGL